jgi:hypothetical protein
METLRILWFNWRCWLNPAMGGTEVFTYEAAKRWVKAGHVTLFASGFQNCERITCDIFYMAIDLLAVFLPPTLH